MGGRNLNTAGNNTAGVMKFTLEPLHSEDSMMMETLPEEAVNFGVSVREKAQLYYDSRGFEKL